MASHGIHGGSSRSILSDAREITWYTAEAARHTGDALSSLSRSLLSFAFRLARMTRDSAHWLARTALGADVRKQRDAGAAGTAAAGDAVALKAIIRDCMQSYLEQETPGARPRLP